MTRQRLLLIAIAALLVLLAFNYLVYQPRQARYRTLTAELVQRQQERDRLRAIVGRTEALEREYSELQAVVAILDAKLPTEKEIPSLLVQLEELVTSMKVDLSVIGPGALQPAQAQTPGGAQAGAQPAGASGYGVVPVRLRVTATYPELVELLGALQNFPRLMAVKTISVGPQVLPKLVAELATEVYVLIKGAQ